MGLVFLSKKPDWPVVLISRHVQLELSSYGKPFMTVFLQGDWSPKRKQDSILLVLPSSMCLGSISLSLAAAMHLHGIRLPPGDGLAEVQRFAAQS